MWIHNVDENVVALRLRRRRRQLGLRLELFLRGQCIRLAVRKKGTVKCLRHVAVDKHDLELGLVLDLARFVVRLALLICSLKE